MTFVAYVINLNQRADRLNRFYQHGDAHYFQRVPAIDKTMLDISTYGNLDYLFNIKQACQILGRDITAGEISCTLSHIQCWKNIANNTDLNNDDFAIVAEDDIQLQPYFYENVQRLFAEIKNKADVNILILQHLFWTNVADLSLANNLVLQFKYLNSLQGQFFDFNSSALYAIRKSHAKTLMNYLDTHKPFWLADHFSCFCPVESMCTISPLLGVIPDGIDAESDLEIERQKARENAKHG